MTNQTSYCAALTYQQLLTAIMHGPEDERPLLLLAATSLTRPWELLDATTRIGDGFVHVNGAVFNNVSVPRRATPLPALLVASLQGRTGTVYDVLHENPRRRGALVEVTRLAVSELELPVSVQLEDLMAVHLSALVETAPTSAHAVAAIAAAGLTVPKRSIGSETPLDPVRAAAWIAETTDQHLRRAARTEATAHSTGL